MSKFTGTIKVTPEMMKAGAIMLDLRRPDIHFVGDDDEQLVRDIFLEMMRHLPANSIPRE